MSRRMTPEVQRLAEDVARRINSGSTADPRLRVSPGEARKLKQELAAERKERRQTSTLYLNRHQLLPWIVGAFVFAVAGIVWLMQWLSDDPFLPGLTILGVDLTAAWVAWMIGREREEKAEVKRRRKLWRSTARRGAIASEVWLLVAAVYGPSWSVVLTWTVLVVLSSLSWWKAHRPGYPKAPAVPVPEVRELESTEMLWAQYIGRKGSRTLPGSLLSGQDTSKPNCEVWTVDLVPGEQSFATAVGHLGLIAGGLHTPIKNLILEPHEDENPNHVKLTIVQNSPIEQTLPYRGARISGEQRNVIEVGPYGDGDGYAGWRMWQPGEKAMTGSWLSGSVIAGTGIGKSRLMELLAAGYMATGNAVVWFVDPQGGASSPALQEHADWYVSSEGVGRMLSALEAIAKAREAQNSRKKWSRFDPTPERPGIIVFLDECHVTIEKYAKRLGDLARKTQKVGIGFVGLTQEASLESLGKDILRACLTANLIVMRTGSNQTKNLLPGLTINPEMLPKIPGFGYTIGESDATRTAPFRSEYVAEPEHWFKRYPMPKLDALSANAAGDVYQLRSAAAAEEEERIRRWVEELENGVVQPTLDDDAMTQKWVEGIGAGEQWALDAAEQAHRNEVEAEERQGGAFRVATFPSSPVGRPQDEVPAQKIVALVAQGVTRTEEILKASPVGKSQTHALLKQLLDEQHLESVTRGVYAIAGSASPPER